MSFCESHTIPVFPFLKFYIRGHPIPYKGKRQKPFLNKFLEDILKVEPQEADLARVEGLNR